MKKPIKKILNPINFCLILFSFHFIPNAQSNESPILKPNTESYSTTATKSSLSYPNHSFKKHNFGGAAGYVSGSGFSYRHWMDNGLGYQISFAPYLVWDETNKKAFFNIGGLGTQIIKDFPSYNPENKFYRGANLFWYYGGNYTFDYEEKSGDFYDPYYNPYSGLIEPSYSKFKNNTEIHKLILGGGLGCEVHFWVFNWTVMAGWSGYTQSKEQNGLFYDWRGITSGDSNPKRSYRLKPTAETAFFVNF